MNDFNRVYAAIGIQEFSDSLDYYVPFSSVPGPEVQYQYPCTGKVYTYGIGVVHTGSVRYMHSSGSGVLALEHRWLCDDAYSVFADGIGDGYAFSVRNAGRTGTAEVELLACLAPQRHVNLLKYVVAGLDTVLQLQYASLKHGRSWAQPHCGNLHGATCVTEGFLGFAVLYLLRKHGALLPDVQSGCHSMPLAGRVVSETLWSVLPREDLVSALRAALAFFTSEGAAGSYATFEDSIRNIALGIHNQDRGTFTLKHTVYYDDNPFITHGELA